mmetsp:Transcript_1359/g.2203  ORF Transcript_1359/g.2203 Transcript_1359/m.2203 type:complete len:103 (-) Transcript_1359:525-833(-)
MDYKGQRLCEYIYSILTILLGAIAWCIGYFQGDFLVTFYGWSIGLGLSLLLCIPDWPMFNRNPVTWLDEIGKSNKPKPPSSKGSKTKKTSSSSKKSSEGKSN